MIDKKIMLLAPGVVLGVMAMAAESAGPVIFPERSGISSKAEALENIGRQELLFRSTAMVNQANKLMQEAKYREAIAKYREVVKLLSPTGAGERFKEKIDFCRKRISECYYMMADEAMKKADDLVTSYDFDEAVKLCEEALEYCPERKEELEKRIKFYSTRRQAAINRENAEITKMEPDFSKQEYQIQLLIEQGIALAKRDELIKAKRKFEEVQLIDPFNAAAQQNMLAINTRIKEAAVARFNATSRRMIGDIEWQAAIPIVAESDAGSGENQLSAPVAKKEAGELEKQLRAIIIPNFVLYDKLQTFKEAVDDLRRQAEENDPSQRGINFVIRDIKHADPKNAPKLAGYSPGKSSLYDILSELQERGDLSFKLDDNAVVIVAKGQQLEKMNVQVFSFALSPDDTAESLMENLKSGAQVTFAPGASLTLSQVRNEVISRNTPANQRKIEHWLANNSEKGTPMVQLMFKFLEVSQNDLDELGFNWQYSRINSNVNFQAGGNSLLRHYANDDANDRFGGNAVAATVNAQGKDDDATYNFNWSDKRNQLGFSVYALDWADSSDILYSPRVTTRAGAQAYVNMSEMHHYPGEYEDIDNENTEKAWVRVVQPQPSLDDEQSLGINNFTVFPKVQGDLITTDVKFTIKQFDSWLIVDSRNLESEDDDGEYQKKAVINSRSISTNVTLRDGETVLIGSIAQDLTTQMHDKIPILGDIPFIGRLFQSRYTISKKNNLLIFMTCKLVDTDGSAWNKDPKTGKAANNGGQRGLPDFSRNL